MLGTKKAGLPQIELVAARLFCPKTRSFPPSPHDEFGFIGINQLPADRGKYLQIIKANNVPDLIKKQITKNFYILSRS